jgi:hypothetical protein
MSFQICIKTDKSLQQLATEIRDLLSLPSFKQDSFAGEPYCQFEVLGMLILIHQADEEEERDAAVIDYPYSFDLQTSFTDHKLDTDDMEYRLQPYYAQLLSFHLGVNSAYKEMQKTGHHWQMRYRFCSKNPNWNSSILYGEEGWVPAVIVAPPGPWRTVLPQY